MCDVPHRSILVLLLFKNLISDSGDISTLSKIMCDTQSGGIAEKLQGRTAIQKG